MMDVSWDLVPPRNLAQRHMVQIVAELLGALSCALGRVIWQSCGWGLGQLSCQLL
jgi:hypothetical protein